MLRGLFSAVAVGAEVLPGAYFSFSSSTLQRGAESLVATLAADIGGLEVPGINETLFWVEPIHFDDVTIGDYEVAVVPGEGVKVSLPNMSNHISHTRIFARSVLGWVKCYGEVWGSASGTSFEAMNKISVGSDGVAQMTVTVPAGGFSLGDVEIHHQMESGKCEALADGLHVLNAAITNVLSKFLEDQLVAFIKDAVEVPVNKALAGLSSPPALGLGSEKFKLDNSILSVIEDANHIMFTNRGQFQSTKNPVESKLSPPTVDTPGSRDAIISFSDYVLNTLFESLFAEHIGEAQVVLPVVKTMFDKECKQCPLVVKSTFSERGQQVMSNGKATLQFTGVNLEIGALTTSASVMPLVTLSLNVSNAMAFDFQETDTGAAVSTTLSLENFEQELLVSHIGVINMQDLSRDVKMVLSVLIDQLNSDIPPLVIPGLGGVKLANTEVVIAEGELRIEADLQKASTILV